MKLKALSNYDGDRNTRFGDCILLYDAINLVVYDCGHERHAKEVKTFLEKHSTIINVSIVVSHNDSDHTEGMAELLHWLYTKGNYSVAVYAHLYLKHADTILDKIDDGRRNRESLKQALLDEFDNIRSVIELAQNYGFSIIEALPYTPVCKCSIVGPTVDEFTDTAAQAVDNRVSDYIGEGDARETVMNAASIQLKCTLDDGNTILLCGDASPDFLKNLNSYHYIQLPHHGQLKNATAIFRELNDSYGKNYLISDNTGSGATSGGSDELCRWMKNENYPAAFNTKSGVVHLPKTAPTIGITAKNQGVRLGAMDRQCR